MPAFTHLNNEDLAGLNITFSLQCYSEIAT